MDDFNSHRGPRSGQRDSQHREQHDDTRSDSRGYPGRQAQSQPFDAAGDGQNPHYTDDFGLQYGSDSRQTAQGKRSVTADWNREESSRYDNRDQNDSRSQQSRAYGDSDSSDGSRRDNNWNRGGPQREEHRYGSSQQYVGSQQQRSNGNGDGDSVRGWTQQRGASQRESRAYSDQGGHQTPATDRLSLHGPYSGKGPKGYKRSDEQICDEANQCLERNGHVDASEIEVSCVDGMVTLRGAVADRRAKRQAEDCVEDIYGVQDVMNELKVDQGFFAKLFNLDGNDESGATKTQHKKS